MYHFVYVPVLWIFFLENALGDGPKNSWIRLKTVHFKPLRSLIAFRLSTFTHFLIKITFRVHGILSDKMKKTQAKKKKKTIIQMDNGERGQLISN